MQEAIALNPRPKVIWMQLGVRNDEAARLAEANGLKVVMNRCPKIEYGRLSSEIAWMGVNTRTISAKKAPLPARGIQRLSLDRATWPAARPMPRPGRSVAKFLILESLEPFPAPAVLTQTNSCRVPSPRTACPVP